MNKISLSVLSLLLAIFILAPQAAFADTTATLLPVSDGFYAQWSPKTGSVHYTMVDEAVCNGQTDFVHTTIDLERDSYGINISSVPNGATITQVNITPCASRTATGTSGIANMDVFYRLNGVNSADAGGYALLGATPVVLSTTSFSGLSSVKTGSTTFEIGAVYANGGNKGERLGQIATVITYTPLTAPTSLSATGSTGSAHLSWTDTASNEDGFKIERSTDSAHFTQINTVSADTTSYTDSPILTGSYYYRVRAYNTGADTAYTNTAFVLVP